MFHTAARTFLLALLVVAPFGAHPLDLHDYWDKRCKDCHGHAGPFARSTLRVEQGRLVGRHHGEDLGRFMQNHYLTEELQAPVTAMLIAQASNSPLFNERCTACHGSAADFARKSLVLKDGVLTGKLGNRPVGEFLGRHGGLAPADIPPMVDTLKRVLAEVGGG